MLGCTNFDRLLLAVQENQQGIHPTTKHARIITAQFIINPLRLEN